MGDKLQLTKEYGLFLKDIQSKLQSAQVRAASSVNRELIQFYWDLGSEILKIQAKMAWGSQFLDIISKDLRASNPGMAGFSKRSLQYMRLLSKIYPDCNQFAQQPAAQLPWTQTQLLLDKFKDDSVRREWYAQASVTHGWSRSVLSMQIKSDLYGRQGVEENKVANYKKLLPSPQSDMAMELLKSPYNFDFLTLTSDAHEREIEKGLIKHIRDFLLELGAGFAFIGTQVPVTVDGEEYFIDALFYHYKLRAFVVIELKSTKFKPADIGQLTFYLAAVDKHYKEEQDNQTIGILLCESRSKIVAEYLLNKINAPIGVSEYILSKALPKNLKVNLPSIEEIEAELNDPDSPKKG